MKRTIIGAIALSFVACGGGDKDEPTKKRKRRKKAKPAVEETETVARPSPKPTKPDPVPAPDVTPDAAPDGPPDPAGVVSTLAARRPIGVICFGWSETRKAAVCHTRIWNRQFDTAFAISFLERVGEGYEYFSVNGESAHREPRPLSKDEIDQERIKAAKKRIREGAYTGWIPRDGVTLRPNKKTKLGELVFERRREKMGDEMSDLVSLRCDKRWVDIELNEETFGGDNRDVATIRAYPTPSPKHVLLTAQLDWGIEGNYGGAEDAYLIEPDEVCGE